MRRFEKISFEQFKKDIKDDETLYSSYEIPIRKTKMSAGYDFELLEDYTILPKEIKKIPTGIKAQMNDNEFLMIVIRSSIGFKNNVRLTNQMGIIDSDYYNNDNNEGHIFLSVQNEGTEPFIINKGKAIAQGIFTSYLMTNDDNADQIRVGGLGSTNEERMKI